MGQEIPNPGRRTTGGRTVKRKLTLCALTDLRDGRFLFVLCFLLYSAVYLGRLNLAAAITEITTTGILEKDAAGLISTAFFIVYGVGQIINGFLSDRVSPFFLIGISVGGSALANLAMFFAMYTSAPLWCWLLIWAVNGYAQSAIYPTLIRLVSGVLPEQMQVSAGANLFASTAVGTMCSNLLCAAIMKFLSWRFCFFVPAVILGAVSVLWSILTRPMGKKTLSYGEATPVQRSQGTEPSKHGLFHAMTVSGGFVMMLVIGVFFVVKESVTVWSPTLLTEIFSAEPSFTVAISTVISVAAVFGAMLARFVLERCLHDEVKSIALLNLLVCIGLILVRTVGMQSIWLMLILLSAVLVLLTGINTLFLAVIPLRFGRLGIASTVTGLLNAMGSAGCAAASYLTGLMAERGGWSSTIWFWLALAAGCVAVELLLIPRWMRFKRM